MSAYCVGLDIRVACDVSRSAKLVANGLGSLSQGSYNLDVPVKDYGRFTCGLSARATRTSQGQVPRRRGVQREGRGSGEMRREELPPSAPFVMDYDHDWAFPSLLVPVVEATSAVR